jgi:hypothetical protein
MNGRGNIAEKCVTLVTTRKKKRGVMCVSGKLILNPFQKTRFGKFALKNITLENEDGQTMKG